MSDRPLGIDEAWVVHLDLPRGPTITVADAHRHVSGHRAGDGAKPWPYYRDAATACWWSLAQESDVVLDRLAWTIPLDQLRHRSLVEARRYLTELLPTLEGAAKRLGGTARAESSIHAALARMAVIARRVDLEGHRVQLLVRAPVEGGRVRDWWTALEGASLKMGDGDLFWRYDQEGAELYCAEPTAGYFHPGDLDGPTRLPDVVLHFRLKEARHPAALLDEMVDAGQRIAASVGGRLLAADGSALDPSRAHRELEEILRELRAGAR